MEGKGDFEKWKRLGLARVKIMYPSGCRLTKALILEVGNFLRSTTKLSDFKLDTRAQNNLARKVSGRDGELFGSPVGSGPVPGIVGNFNTIPSPVSVLDSDSREKSGAWGLHGLFNVKRPFCPYTLFLR
jgi:hypothetical protein